MTRNPPPLLRQDALRRVSIRSKRAARKIHLDGDEDEIYYFATRDTFGEVQHHLLTTAGASRTFDNLSEMPDWTSWIRLLASDARTRG
jgi:hypothetical protein